jgi:hypothetical protein
MSSARPVSNVTIGDINAEPGATVYAGYSASVPMH